ncbi:MAG: hypothetical protein RLO17_17600 [Cyclobacteriaceae bacterium]
MIRILSFITLIQCNILFPGFCQEITSQQFGSTDELFTSIDQLNIDRLNINSALVTLEKLEQELISKDSFNTVVHLFINRNQLAHGGQQYWLFGINDKTGKYIYSFRGTESFELMELKKREIKEIKELISEYEPSNSYLQLNTIQSDYQMLIIFKSNQSKAGIFTNYKFEASPEPNFPSDAFVELANYLWIYR